MIGRPSIYSDDTVAQMRVLWDAGLTNEAIAKRFKISRGAMSRLAERRGFARRTGNIWKPEEDAILRAASQAGKDCLEVSAMIPGRSASAVKHRRKSLGINPTGRELAMTQDRGALALNVLVARAKRWEPDKSNPQPPQTVHAVFPADLRCEAVPYTPEHAGCRWMISGGRPWTVCAAKRADGESYCRAHSDRSSYFTQREMAA
jgi:hypothetical protein